MKEIVCGVDAMYGYAAHFVSTLKKKDTAVVVGLTGGLGSGKTTFVQGAARALGITDHITSPTFVIEKIYSLENRPFKKLIHIDAYRLKDAHELTVLGWNELISDPANLIFIEWPENAAEVLPKEMTTIQCAFVDEKTRSVVLP